MEGFGQLMHKDVKLWNKGNGAFTGTSESPQVATSSAQEYEDEIQIEPGQGSGASTRRRKNLLEPSSFDEEEKDEIQHLEPGQGSGALTRRRKNLLEPSSFDEEEKDEIQILEPEQGSGALLRRHTSLSETTSSAKEHKDASQISKPVELPDNKNSGGRPGCSNTKEGDYYQRYIPLYKAAQRGDWETADAFFKKDEDAFTAKINAYSETALHVAIGAGTSSKLIFFVEKLVGMMPPEVLECRDDHGRTPFDAAVAVGNIEAVKFLWQRGTSQYRRAQFWSALYTVARNARKDILLFLLDVSENDEFFQVFPNEDSAAHFLILVIESGYYDIASYLVKKYPSLATSIRVNGDFGLKVLARKVSAFKSGSYHRGWQGIIYNRVYVELVTKEESTSHIKGDIETGIDGPQVTRQRRNWARHLVENFWTFVPCIKHIQDEKKMHLQALQLVKYLCEGLKSQNNSHDADKLAKDALLTAAKLGIHEVMEAILESFPKLIWAADDNGLNLFHIAVEKRHANVFNLIYRIGAKRELLVQMRDPSGNNLLHLAGKLAPRNKYNLVIGAALQMQRELQWFEEVKKFAKPRDIDWLNNNGETPTTTFAHEHEGLRAEGEKWMKDAANSLTVPAGLVVTVVFAAAITVPGGLNPNGDGIPVFSKEVVFNVFAIFTAISLCASITSLLVSLSILTSRFAQNDFLFSLPRSLAIAVFTLFPSITAMAVAFSSALYIMLGNRDKPLILCLVVAVACIPIISFAILHTFHLLLHLIVSTYCPRIFSKQSDRPFY